MSNLKWTTETPSEPGWYLAKSGDGTRFVLIEAGYPFLRIGACFERKSGRASSTHALPLVSRWCRIPEPEEPSEAES